MAAGAAARAADLGSPCLGPRPAPPHRHRVPGNSPRRGRRRYRGWRLAVGGNRGLCLVSGAGGGAGRPRDHRRSSVHCSATAGAPTSSTASSLVIIASGPPSAGKVSQTSVSSTARWAGRRCSEPGGEAARRRRPSSGSSSPRSSSPSVSGPQCSSSTATTASSSSPRVSPGTRCCVTTTCPAPSCSMAVRDICSRDRRTGLTCSGVRQHGSGTMRPGGGPRGRRLARAV